MVYGNESSDIGYSVVLNVCENCGATCETLIDLPNWNFKACATCAEDAAREDERDMNNNKTESIPAAAWMASFSSAGRDFAPKVCVNCKANPARPDSIYCSDACRNAFLHFPTEPKVMVVDRWDGQKWIEVRLEWNGTEYKETK